jgi:hypothetical protein
VGESIRFNDTAGKIEEKCEPKFRNSNYFLLEQSDEVMNF